MQKIVPNIWCQGNAKEVADYYVSIFPNSKITGKSKYPESAEEGLADFQTEFAGKELTVEVNLNGQDFTLINAGPEFTPNPSISFMVDFNPGEDVDAKEHLKQTYDRLIEGGEAMMPLDKYPFSEYYGWVKDKFGVSWQLIMSEEGDEERQSIIPALLFGSTVQNRAKEALEYYESVFENAKIGTLAPYGEPTGPATAEALMYGDIKIGDQWLVAMDSGVEQDFTFSEGVSLVVNCKDQDEIDYLWSKLSSVPEAEQCGWCKDKFGVSWQIVPENIEELMKKPGAFKTMMDQHKIIISEY